MSEAWQQVLVLVFANACIMMCSTIISRHDHKECAELIHAIHMDMKDFHDRLCAIEDRYRR